MGKLDVTQFAAELNLPVALLLEQLHAAGGKQSSAMDLVSEKDKAQLLEHLRKAHGADPSAKKITLTRRETTEIQSSDKSGRARTIQVEVRKRRIVAPMSIESVQAAAPVILTSAEQMKVLGSAELDSRQQEAKLQAELAARQEAELIARQEFNKRRAEKLIQAAAPAKPILPEKVEVIKEVPVAPVEVVVVAAAAPVPAPVAPKPADLPHGTLHRPAMKPGDKVIRPDRKPKVEVKAVTPTSPVREEKTKRIPAKTTERPPAKTATKEKSWSTATRAPKHGRHSKQVVDDAAHAFTLPTEAVVREVAVPETIVVAELAQKLSVKAVEVIKVLMKMGMMVTINQVLDQETAMIVVEELGHIAKAAKLDDPDAYLMDDEVHHDVEPLPRAPVVTVMGHVDHGKTSLLDYIRRTRVVSGEAGGITQHIGAYHVETPRGMVSFLDTPGHEAFTAMRARGASITDVAIIVIAADETVMPQTREAINHALAAGVPIVFAFNKMDKANANPEKIREELSKMNILVEEWGGKYQTQEISAKVGTNVDLLLEKVLLEAEMLNLKANPTRLATGTVVESSLDKGRGYVSKLLVQNGTLRVGDIVLAGATYGKVKAMYNERNIQIREAGPSQPMLMLGLNGAPQAGDGFNVMADEKESKAIATKRLQLQREQGLRTQKHITLDEIGRRIAIGDFKELNIIVKGDVDGSVEALSDSLLKLSNEEVMVNVIHKSVGAITESDVLLASASNAVIVGFQVRPSVSARKLAEAEQIDIRLYSIIYQAIEEIKAAIEGMLSPEIEEKILCNIEVRDVFRITKVGTVAGCMVLDGKVTRNTKIRVIRDGIVVWTGNLGSLKRFKDDVKEVLTGYECGLNIENFNDIQVGDIVEGYEQIEVKRKL